MPTIHMICGPVGVGKTTYAAKLAADIGAVRFSIDDWISELFFPDRPMPLTYDWAVERAKRCEARILVVSRDVLALGTDVIWDLGFMESTQRRRILDDVGNWPCAVRLHALEAPTDIRRERGAPTATPLRSPTKSSTSWKADPSPSTTAKPTIWSESTTVNAY